MSLRSPLGQARGLGSAKSGTQHWWMQRLTAVALVPLSLWLVAGLACLAGADFAAVTAWLSQPLTAVAMILFLATMFYHSQLGLQVVIEDYVHGEFTRIASLVIMKFAHVALATAGIFAVLKVAFG
ncbi:MAG: succinate dehydrogenase, hydrophobic membrane anchor protein [Oceanococcus sp.]